MGGEQGHALGQSGHAFTPNASSGIRQCGRCPAMGGFVLAETDRPEGLSPRRGIGFQPVVAGRLRHIASMPSKALHGCRSGKWSSFGIHFQRLTDQKVCHHVVKQAFSLLALDSFGTLHPSHRKPLRGPPWLRVPIRESRSFLNHAPPENCGSSNQRRHRRRPAVSRMTAPEGPKTVAGG